ncbi:nucleotide sugar dehydrogenase [Virgibacillus salinus]|uniref:UDP-N-acetyl-D-mannosaminuronic acid dehydrogenase n=1 Tax=Virgibacillus salinus TaxID=553311 RepID=A0A1H0YIU7_9BACI|nr:nucleotide sugar dehydrogenase [Virgibacillus salinus]SDQ15003.1 UDP-N-acetyl-D-mannosaminuronic acid dehydrogenase [Virgibacillus salinus]
MISKLCVIGLGYIGLPTAVVFAQNGWEVTGVDINSLAIDELNKGRVHIKENGLEEAVKEVVVEKKFCARMSPVEADVFVIAVPTPHNHDLTANLRYVENAIKSILPVLKLGDTIILESTIPPRTTRDVVAPIIDEAGFKSGDDIYLAHCPERVLPGKILKELYENNRTVGGINSNSTEKAAKVYRSFVQGKILETTAESAEMSKLMENTYRDVNIALANELTKISEGLNIDVLEVISLANEHPRVNVHQPGPGVGGHCLAVDPYFIIEKDPENAKLISNARTINNSMPEFVIDQMKKVVKTSSKIAIFGLAYKGNIDDVRESPAMKIAEQLMTENYNVEAYDPYVKQEQITFKLSSYKNALQNADILLILTEHDEFKCLDWQEIDQLMTTPNVLDTKNCVKNVAEQINYYNFGNLYNLKEIEWLVK